jgi:hypothetical protein
VKTFDGILRNQAKPMSARDQIRAMLSGGDRRSIGRVAEIVDLIDHHPKTISSLIDCLWDEDACVRMRAADALEKISREQAFFFATTNGPSAGFTRRNYSAELVRHSGRLA